MQALAEHSKAVVFDQRLRAALTALRFLADAYNVLIVVPVRAERRSSPRIKTYRRPPRPQRPHRAGRQTV